MKTFDEILLEASSEDKLLITDNTIWFTYGPNSGIAIPLANKSYFTDKKGDSNYDPNLMSKMIKYSKTVKPIKSKGNMSLFEIPVYADNDATNYDIWGGKTKPKTKKYAILTKGKINVLTIFDSKNEALSWIKTSV